MCLFLKSAVGDGVIEQHGIFATGFVPRLNGSSGRVVIAELQLRLVRIGSIIEEVILILQIGEREYRSIVIIVNQSEGRNTGCHSQLEPLVSAVFEFYLFLKILIAIYIYIHILIRQRGCCRRIPIFLHSRSGFADNNELQIHRSVYRQRDLLHSLIYIRISPQRDILGVAIGCVQGTFHQLGLTILFLIQRTALEFVLTEDKRLIVLSVFTRHDEIALSIHYRRPYQLLALQGSLYQRYLTANRIRYCIDCNLGVDEQRIIIQAGIVFSLCNQRYLIIQYFCVIFIKID